MFPSMLRIGFDMARCDQCGAFVERNERLCAACTADGRPRGSTFSVDSTSAARAAGADFEAPFAGEVDGDAGRLVRIARFRSAAEAGFFADLLNRREIAPAEIAVEEEHDALHGSWAVRFALLVPSLQAETAAVALKRLIEETDDQAGLCAYDAEEFAAAEEFADEAVHVPMAAAVAVEPRWNGAIDAADDESLPLVEASGVNWVPIVLTLAAGSAALFGARKVMEAPRVRAADAPARVRQEGAWADLAKERAPWRQELRNGKGTREMFLLPNPDRAVIREDADGDGRFESERVFLLRPAQ